MGRQSSIAIALIVVAIVAFGAGVLYVTYFVGSGPILSSEPRIRLPDITISYPAGREPLGCLGAPNSFFLPVTISFNLVNSGEVDGFATVEMVARGEVVNSNEYFVRTDTREPKSLSKELICNMEEGEISVRIAALERG